MQMRCAQGDQDHQSIIETGLDHQILREQENHQKVGHIVDHQDLTEGFHLEVATEISLLLDLGHVGHLVPPGDIPLVREETPIILPRPDLEETHQEEDDLILINDLPLPESGLLLQEKYLHQESNLPLLAAALDHPGELPDLLLGEIDLDHPFAVWLVLLDGLPRGVPEDRIDHLLHTDIQVDSDLLSSLTDQEYLINEGHAARYTVVAPGHHSTRVEGIGHVMDVGHDLLVADVDPAVAHGLDDVTGTTASQRKSELIPNTHTDACPQKKAIYTHLVG